MKRRPTARIVCVAAVLILTLFAGGCLVDDATRTKLEDKIAQVDQVLAQAQPYLAELEKIVGAGKAYAESLPAEDPQRVEVVKYVTAGQDFVASVKDGTAKLETLSADLKAKLASLPESSGSSAADTLATVGAVGSSIGPVLPQPIGIAVTAISSVLTGIASFIAVRAKKKAAQETQISESIVNSIESAKAAGAISFTDAVAGILRATQTPEARARVDEIQWNRS